MVRLTPKGKRVVEKLRRIEKRWGKEAGLKWIEREMDRGLFEAHQRNKSNLL